MAYSNNPYAPKARRAAVDLVVRQGMSVAEAARRSGVHRTTLYRWIEKAKTLDLAWNAHIPTLSSAPRHHPHTLPDEIVAAIVAERQRSGRGAYFIHLELQERGVAVSLSSVKRTLRRQGLTKPISKWKRHRPYIPRPLANKPGDLVQADTIHFVQRDGGRFYVYTLIDLFSRAAYAEYSPKCNQRASFHFVMRGQDYLGISLAMLQTDNGPEFGKWFHDQLNSKGIALRHSRVRKSNDNAHIERFNRTIQEECLSPNIRASIVPERIYWYLACYNQFRRHSSINGNYPLDLLDWHSC